MTDKIKPEEKQLEKKLQDKPENERLHLSQHLGKFPDVSELLKISNPGVKVK